VAFLSQLLLLGLGIFLMIVILLQRGRGGGLAGAFGGLGGQSAFGTKAGDVFTRITIVLAVCWVIVAGSSGYFLRAGAEQRASGLGDVETLSPGEDAMEGDADFNALEETETLPPPVTPPGTDGTSEPGAPAENEGDATTTPAPEGTAPGSPDSPTGDDAAADPGAQTPPATPESSNQ
jgi:preprotein translocase subunit SecG